MKKFLFISLILFSMASYAQTNISLKFAPLISSNRVTNDQLDAENDGTSFKFSLGVVVDQPLSDTYSFSSGLIYVPKRVAFIEKDTAGVSFTEEYKTQYLQIPLTLKLFTNEVAPDVKVFFQIGAGLEFKVFDEKEDPSYNAIEKFAAFDIPVILGSGIEYRAGINTTLFAGVSYQRGLTNVINSTNLGLYDDLEVRNTVVSFDLGVKF